MRRHRDGLLEAQSVVDRVVYHAMSAEGVAGPRAPYPDLILTHAGGQ